MALHRDDSMRRASLLVVLCAVLTITLQLVGKETIYHERHEAKRNFLHDAIYTNKLPEGKTWDDYGARGVNTRVGSIYAVALLHRWTGVSVGTWYVWLDSTFLFLSFLALFLYLRKWVPYGYCLIGILFVGNVFILTYFHHHFHPWDRISLFQWIVLLYLIRSKSDVLFFLVMMASIPFKFDVIILPVLYLIYNFFTQQAKKAVIVKGMLFLVSGIAFYELLKYSLIGSVPDTVGVLAINPWLNALTQVTKNLRHMVSLNIAYPPMLMFALPLILSLFNWDKKDAFIRTSLVFALGMLCIHFSLANFREVRAETMILVLILPSALISLREIINGRTEALQSGLSDED